MDDMAIRDIEVVSEEGDGEEPSFVTYGNIGEALATDNLSDQLWAWWVSLPQPLQSERAPWTPEEALEQLRVYQAPFRRLLHESIEGARSLESEHFFSMHAHEHIQFSSRFLSYFPYQGAGAKTRAESTLSLYPRPTCPVDLLCRDLWDFLNSCEKARLRECPCGCKRFFLLSPRDLYYSETCWYRSPPLKRFGGQDVVLDVLALQEHI